MFGQIFGVRREKDVENKAIIHTPARSNLGGSLALEPCVRRSIRNPLENLTLEEVEEYRQIFVHFDADNSGEIDLEEMMRAMQEVGFATTRKQTADIIREVDYNSNGKVDFEEFCSCILKFSAKAEEDKDIVKQCFMIFDQDGNGEISKEEFISVLTNIGDFPLPLAESVFGEVDLTRNGVVDENEFEAFVQSYLFPEDDDSLFSHSP